MENYHTELVRLYWSFFWRIQKYKSTWVMIFGQFLPFYSSCMFIGNYNIERFSYCAWFITGLYYHLSVILYHWMFILFISMLSWNHSHILIFLTLSKLIKNTFLNRVLICKNGLRRMHEKVRTCVLICNKNHGVEDRYICQKSLLQFSKTMLHLSRIELTTSQLLCFHPSFTQIKKMPVQP